MVVPSCLSFYRIRPFAVNGFVCDHFNFLPIRPQDAHICGRCPLRQHRTIRLRHLPEKPCPDLVTFSCNTQSIPAKNCLHQNPVFLGICSCRIMRYCLNALEQAEYSLKSDIAITSRGIFSITVPALSRFSLIHVPYCSSPAKRSRWPKGRSRQSSGRRVPRPYSRQARAWQLPSGSVRSVRRRGSRMG